MSESRNISKALSYWLRHAPEAVGLQLDSGGWAATDDVLAALREAGLPGTRPDLERVVAESDKNRFELSPAGDRLRARQGHSIAVEGDWRPASPPAVLFHGTVDRFVEAILAEGLVPRSRHHVHLSPDVETASAVGARRGKPVILEVKAAELAASGAAFWLSGNGVWLIEHVPAWALRRLD